MGQSCDEPVAMFKGSFEHHSITAPPPDMRKRLCPSVPAPPLMIGAAPQGVAQKEYRTGRRGKANGAHQEAKPLQSSRLRPLSQNALRKTNGARGHRQYCIVSPLT